jgi:hypothetical protein
MFLDVTPPSSARRTMNEMLRPRTYRQCSEESMDKSSKYAKVNLARTRLSEGSTQTPVESARWRPGDTTHRYQHLRAQLKDSVLKGQSSELAVGCGSVCELITWQEVPSMWRQRFMHPGSHQSFPHSSHSLTSAAGIAW